MKIGFPGQKGYDAKSCFEIFCKKDHENYLIETVVNLKSLGVIRAQMFT